MLPKVSILIPTYNRPVFFELALLSAVKQTYQNTEVVVCDDSTDDSTQALIEPYLAKFRQVKYFRNPSTLGALANFRRCFELSTGDYVNYLMDDDLFHEQKIERMMAYFLRYDSIRLATSYRQLIDPDGNHLAPMRSTIRLSSEDRLIDGKMLGDLTLKSLNNVIGEPTTVLFRKRDLLEPFGAFMGRDYGCNVDMASWIALLSSGQAAFLADTLSYSRVHQDQQSQSIRMTVLGTADWVHQIIAAPQLGFLSEIADYRVAASHCLDLVVYTITSAVAAESGSLVAATDLQANLQELLYSLLT